MSYTDNTTARVDVVGDITTVRNRFGAIVDLDTVDMLTVAPAIYALARYALAASPLDDDAKAQRLQELDTAMQTHEIEWGQIA